MLKWHFPAFHIHLMLKEQFTAVRFIYTSATHWKRFKFGSVPQYKTTTWFQKTWDVVHEYFYALWSLTASGHCLQKSSMNIVLNVSFQRKSYRLGITWGLIIDDDFGEPPFNFWPTLCLLCSSHIHRQIKLIYKYMNKFTWNV